jgi:Fe-S cluster assembly scaffold protein SufB
MLMQDKHSMLDTAYTFNPITEFKLDLDQEFIVLSNGNILSQNLNKNNWRQENNALKLIANKASLIIFHAPNQNTKENIEHKDPSYFSITLTEKSYLNLSECFKGNPPATTHFLLKANASLDHTLIDLLDQDQEQQNKIHKRISNFVLESRSTLNSQLFLQGSVLNHYHHSVALTGPKAYYKLKACLLAQDSTNIKLESQVQHQTIESDSSQTIRCLVQKQGTSSVRGHILVAPKAQESQAHLDHKALLLDESAVAKVQPELEIYADAVKCSHGASVCQLEEDSLFFLRSRGLNKKQAAHLLIEGFLAPVLPSMPLNSFLNTIIANKISVFTRLKDE